MLFSVIVPVFNSEKYVSRAIKSVLRQNVDFEHLKIVYQKAHPKAKKNKEA